MRERDGARRQASVRAEGMARSACGGAAGSVARVSVSRGDAPDRRSARVGVYEDQTILVAAQKAGGFLQRLVYIGTRNAEETREPVGSRPGV